MAFRQRTRCFVCNRQFVPNQTVRIVGLEEANQTIITARRQNNDLPPDDIAEQSRICFNCNNSVNQEINLLQNDPACLRLNVAIQRHNHACLVCAAPAGGLQAISNICRAQVFIEKNIYLPESLYACEEHFDEEGILTEDVMQNLRSINRPIVLRGEELATLLESMRLAALANKQLSESMLSDPDFQIITSITKDQFNDLYSFCDDVILPGEEEQNKRRRISRIDLLTFLCKLRQGLSDDLLRIMFGYSSRSAVSMAITKVRISLTRRFVPANIGFAAMTREDFIEHHVSDFANELYNPEPETKVAIAYIDATYAFTPKSSNFDVLRKSFNLHKHRHLVKLVVVTGPTGYFLDIHGPYFSNARNNDANILNQKLRRLADDMLAWFRPEDIFVVDRGYRDSIGLLQELGIDHQMPSMLAPGQKQFTTEQANHSRLVTKTRWIVEARNGHLKTIFKFLDGIVSIVHLENIGDFYRIGGAMINRYRPEIHMRGADIELARECLRRSRLPNLLQQRVEAEQLHRRNAQRWMKLNANQVPDFPLLTIRYLEDLTVGVYQLKLSRSYVQDKVTRENNTNEAEDYEVEMLRNEDRLPEPGLIRIRLFSRFRQATKHQLWISYNPIENPENDEGRDQAPITGYYCTCVSGARTLGCCAHVASVLWYLGYARHEENVRLPPTNLNQSVLDCGRVPSDEDEDE